MNYIQLFLLSYGKQRHCNGINLTLACKIEIGGCVAQKMGAPPLRATSGDDAASSACSYCELMKVRERARGVKEFVRDGTVALALLVC